ncbi:hypothetical protein Y032_0224g2690 [Ancylostoma ceylanicum]|uniref:guanylate cyclase n=1 Tax=Ancylostoma ceylanicum TaxID=53326 RepID=A0A016SI25_9BILA|nr:hypothetical protein Y032_0224g2690 [Ancylostoma ceylanicum]
MISYRTDIDRLHSQLRSWMAEWIVTQTYLLWTAPEILRSSNSGKSKEADIYSFGIICAQVVTQSPPWDLDNRKEDPEELIYMIKKGGHNAPRPPLDVQENGDVNQALVRLKIFTMIWLIL